MEIFSKFSGAECPPYLHIIEEEYSISLDLRLINFTTFLWKMK